MAEITIVGMVGFLSPFLGCTAIALYGLGWNWQVMGDCPLLSTLLYEETDVGEHVLPLGFSQPPLPRMHRAEHHSLLDRSEQLFVGFHIGFEIVKVGRRHLERGGIRTVAGSATAVTSEAVTLVQGLAPARVRWKILRGRKANGRDDGRHREGSKTADTKEGLNSSRHVGLGSVQCFLFLIVCVIIVETGG